MSRDNWGQRARIGMFIVGAEVVPEAEWWAMVLDGVSVHAARVSAPAPWATWTDDRTAVQLSPDVQRGAQQFAALALSAVVVAHSSSSVIGGQGWDDATAVALKAVLHADTKITTNGTDCVWALRHSGVTRPFLVFPPWFGQGAIDAGTAYFGAAGFRDPISVRHRPEARWADVPPQQLYGRLMHIQQRTDLLFDQIVAECPAEADGVLIVGTGVRCVAIIDALEERLGRTVVTANQASLWRCLELSGVDVPISGYGQLLSG